MTNGGKNAARKERTQQRLESGLVSEHFPGVSSIVIHMTNSYAGEQQGANYCEGENIFQYMHENSFLFNKLPLSWLHIKNVIPDWPVASGDSSALRRIRRGEPGRESFFAMFFIKSKKSE